MVYAKAAVFLLSVCPENIVEIDVHERLSLAKYFSLYLKLRCSWMKKKPILLPVLKFDTK